VCVPGTPLPFLLFLFYVAALYFISPLTHAHTTNTCWTPPPPPFDLSSTLIHTRSADIASLRQATRKKSCNMDRYRRIETIGQVNRLIDDRTTTV
jgi:hypothetical protein